MIEFLKEFWDFLKIRKKYWLLPILIILLFFGFLIVLTQGTVIAPFIYTIFLEESQLFFTTNVIFLNEFPFSLFFERNYFNLI